MFKCEEDDSDDLSLDEEEESVLQKEKAISQSIPRQRRRTQYREKAGFAPNMMPEQEISGMLLKGDLVFHSNIEDIIEYHIVQVDFKLVE